MFFLYASKIKAWVDSMMLSLVSSENNLQSFYNHIYDLFNIILF